MNSKKTVDKILGVFVVAVMALLVVDVVWNVLARNLLNTDSSYTMELARYLLIWVGLFGSAYVTGQREHIAIELFPQKLEKKDPGKKKKLDFILNLLIALFGLFPLVIGGTKLVFITLKMSQISPTLQIPLGYVYLCLPISGGLIMFYSIHAMIYGNPKDHPIEKETYQ